MATKKLLFYILKRVNCKQGTMVQFTAVKLGMGLSVIIIDIKSPKYIMIRPVYTVRDVLSELT